MNWTTLNNDKMNSATSYTDETTNSTTSYMDKMMNSTTSYLKETMGNALHVNETMTSTTSYTDQAMNSTNSYMEEVMNSRDSYNETINSSASYNGTMNANIELNTALPYISTIASTIVIIGFLANVFTIIVMTQKESRKMSVARLLVVLSVSDSVCLWCNSFNSEHITFIGIDIVTTFIGCKIYFWFRFTFALVSHLLIVVISGERLVAVCFYLRASRINTIRNAHITAAGVFCISGGFTAAFILQWSGVNGACIFDNIEGAKRSMTVLYSMLYILVPVPVLIIMNSITSFKLCSKQVGQIKHRNLTLMLLITTALFILFVLPGCLAFNRRIGASPQMKELSQLFLTINYAANFFIYVIIGKRFRRNMCLMFRRNIAVSPESGNSNGTLAFPMQVTRSTRTVAFQNGP